MGCGGGGGKRGPSSWSSKAPGSESEGWAFVAADVASCWVVRQLYRGSHSR